MSGHSKWHTIKHKKGAADAKRGKVFTRIIKELTVAARAGGGDIDSNPRLRTIVAEAKSVNMPADNIKRAIQRGTGELPGVNYEEITYEGYGPGGAALIIETLTDNKNRTVGEMRHLLGKYGGNLAAENSVAWMFDGDGHDTLQGFEDVVGSPQGDEIVGDGGVNRLDGGVGDDDLDGMGGPDEAFGGAGSDECDGFATEHSCGAEPNPPGSGTFVILNQGLDGTQPHRAGQRRRQRHPRLLRRRLGGLRRRPGASPGEGCAATAASTAVTCPTSVRDRPARHHRRRRRRRDRDRRQRPAPASRCAPTATPAPTRSAAAPATTCSRPARTTTGPNNGNDTLVGNPGSDVLYADPGADQLAGGPGNDLLVSSVAVCQGHSYSGGPGDDTVSYGRSNAGADGRARRHRAAPPAAEPRTASAATTRTSRAPTGPTSWSATTASNSFMGHLGADTFIGKGGSDFIDAIDGQRDRSIQCGGGDDDVISGSLRPEAERLLSGPGPLRRCSCAASPARAR